MFYVKPLITKKVKNYTVNFSNTLFNWLKITCTMFT